MDKQKVKELADLVAERLHEILASGHKVSDMWLVVLGVIHGLVPAKEKEDYARAVLSVLGRRGGKKTARKRAQTKTKRERADEATRRAWWNRD